MDVLIDSLLRAWGRHGASRELYVDNAKIYHANAVPVSEPVPVPVSDPVRQSNDLRPS